MAIPSDILNSPMGYYDPVQDRVRLQQRDAFAQMLQAQHQMNTLAGLHNSQQAQQVKPVTNPEPNPVLLLLE